MDLLLIFLLAFSLILNIIFIITSVIIYKKFLKKNLLFNLNKICKIDREFWDI